MCVGLFVYTNLIDLFIYYIILQLNKKLINSEFYKQEKNTKYNTHGVI